MNREFVLLMEFSKYIQGRVEHCSNGEWYTICDDRWGSDEARVVCRQLGYESQGEIGWQQN